MTHTVLWERCDELGAKTGGGNRAADDEEVDVGELDEFDDAIADVIGAFILAE